MHESEEEQRSRLAYEASLRALDQQRQSLGIVVLALHEGLRFSLSGPALHTGLLLAHSRAHQHRQLAMWLDALWARNKPAIERLDIRFRLAAVALALQIVLWTFALGASVA